MPVISGNRLFCIYSATVSVLPVCFSSSEDSQDVSQSPQPGEQLTEQGPRGWDEEDRLDEDEDVSSSLDDSDIEDETEEEEEENEEEEDLHPRQRVITFSHTKALDDVIQH